MPRCPSGHFDTSSASAWLCRRFAQANADPDTVVYSAEVESQPTVVYSAELESQPSCATAPMSRRKKKSQRLRRQARKPRTDEDDLWDYMLLTEFEHDILDGEVTCPGCGSLLQCRSVTPGRTPCPACQMTLSTLPSVLKTSNLC